DGRGNRGSRRRSGGDAGEEGQRRGAAAMPEQIVYRASRDHRPRLLPREIGRGGCRNRRYSGSDREDPHVLRAQEIIRAPQGAGDRSRLAMNTDMNTANENERNEIEDLLPWHAAGTLSAREAQSVEAALARDPELARRYE